MEIEYMKASKSIKNVITFSEPLETLVTFYIKQRSLIFKFISPVALQMHWPLIGK